MKNSLTITLIAIFFVSLSSCSHSQPSQDDFGCHEQLSEFGNVEIVGSFAHDLGCIYETMTIDGKQYAYDQGVKILAAQHFSSKNDDIMINLVNRLYFQHSHIVFSEEESFTAEGQSFVAPTIVRKNKTIVIECWVKEPAQMQPIDGFSYCTITIHDNGKIEHTSGRSFSHEF